MRLSIWSGVFRMTDYFLSRVRIIWFTGCCAELQRRSGSRSLPCTVITVALVAGRINSLLNPTSNLKKKKKKYDIAHYFTPFPSDFCKDDFWEYGGFGGHYLSPGYLKKIDKKNSIWVKAEFIYLIIHFMLLHNLDHVLPPAALKGGAIVSYLFSFLKFWITLKSNFK